MANWRARLLELMRERGLNAKQLSIAAKLGETAVRDLLQKVVSPRLDTLDRLAGVLGVDIVDLIGDDVEGRRVPLVGYVSAGEGWLPFEDDGPIEDVRLRLPGKDAVALLVRGTSMQPVYRDGDYIVGLKRAATNADNLIGLDCIVQTRDGGRYVKFLSRGSRRGLFNLRSYNPQHQDVVDVELAWAAPISIVIRAKS